MNHWHQYPFIRLLAPLITGIVIAKTTGPFVTPTLLLLLLVATLVLERVMVRFADISFRYRWFTGFAFFIAVLIIGMGLTFEKKKGLSGYLGVKPELEANSGFVIMLNENATEKPNSLKCAAELLYCKGSPFEGSRTGILAYFEKPVPIDLKMGDVLYINESLKEISPPSNPSQFNYKNYLASKGIFYQCYVGKDTFVKIDSLKGNRLMMFSTQLRDHCLALFRKYGLKDKEFGVASALIIGDKNFIDTDTRQNYAAAGAMHILCVSGLHVGIVYLFFAFILKFLLRLKHGAVIQAILLVMIIWFYALLTGLSPSVLRASTMFSMMAIGRVFRRNSNIFNTLAASAFVLLTIDPYMLFETGFQLSYLAVAGIVLVHPLLYAMWNPLNPLLDKIWSLVCVSIAAQVLTFPVSLYMFHQFPNYFILTNILVIPLSFFIVFGGIVMMVLSFIPFLPEIIMFVFRYLVLILNYSVGFIHSLPYSTSNDIYISITQMGLIYTCILILLVIWVTHNFKWLKYLLLTFILLNIDFWYESYNKGKQEKFYVYSLSHGTAIDFISGESRVFMADSLLMHDEQYLNFHLGNHWIRLGSDHVCRMPLQYGHFNQHNIQQRGRFLFFGEKVFYFLGESRIPVVKDLLPIDYVILYNSPETGIEEIRQKINPGLLIIAEANKPWLVEKWIKECSELRIPYHSIKHQGHYTADI